MNEKTVCPRCGQDFVVRARIKPLDEPILICPECEAFWRPGTPVTRETFSDYATYVISRGLEWDWRLLELEA